MLAKGSVVKIVLGSLGLWLLGSALNAGEAPRPELLIYTYDSFVAKGGFGAGLIESFEKKCGCHVRALATGDGGQILNQVERDEERRVPGAQLVVGIDQLLWPRVRKFARAWGEWMPAGFAEVAPEARLGPDFLPFDYGIFALMADEQQLTKLGLVAPASLADLVKPEYRRRFVLEDPRSSTPGQAFAVYSHRQLGTGSAAFWTRLASSWLTLPGGWDAAYGLFLKGEAPLVWSYTTSQAYHEEHGDQARRYRAVAFRDGNPVQIEGAALLKRGTDNPESLRLARAFLDHLLSREQQARIPRKNWMYPARAGTPLPASFAHLPQPRRLDLRATEAEMAEIQASWAKAVRQADAR